MIVRFEDTSPDQIEQIGRKGACLGEMARLGLNVPPGFVVPADVGRNLEEKGGRLPDDVFESIKQGVAEIEQRTGCRLGGTRTPLLLSVRSTSAVIMPGMMDTIINLGMNDEVASTLLAETGDLHYVYDSLRRFTQVYAQVVMGMKPASFDKVVQDMLNRQGVFSEADLDPAQLKKLSENFRKLIKKATGRDIPEDPYEQLREAVAAIFMSWNNPRAVVYRRLRRISNHYGASAIVQGMVFGNRGERSASGVVVTRDPIVGAKQLFGEYLICSQGEDVLSGLRTPKKIADLQGDIYPAYEELSKVAQLLESHFREAQEIEFTIQDERLYLLQTRAAQCTAQGKIKIVVDMVREGLLTKREGVLKVEPELLDQILHSHIDPNVQIRSIMRGIPASPGAAFGAVAFSVEEVEKLAAAGRDPILVRPETNTDDVRGIDTAVAILTQRGGATSHAAVAARRSGKPCVTGCESMHINLDRGEFVVGDLKFKRGDIITVDGGSGRVFSGTVPMRSTSISPEFQQLLDWADEVRTLKIRANADTPDDAERAIEFGAEGIGLCRTEAMFMAADRLPSMRAMILEDNQEKREKLLTELLAIQKKDFVEIFQVVKGRPVTVRLLDPPLHEFLPNIEGLMKEVAVLRSSGDAPNEILPKEELLNRVMSHQEANPMLGLRGCRLGIISPEIIEMQMTAVLEAACELANQGVPVKPEIMVPLVGHVKELKWVRERLEAVAKKVIAKCGFDLEYTIGVLIEVPRAALTAKKLAEHADFFSFGTNDLTQTTFAFSRDDAEVKFLHHYHDIGILEDNPFETIDMDGVGRLLRIATHDGREAKPNLQIGLCGEQGGEPATIAFCYSLGLDFVSCSPYRVPIARLAAAQAAIRNGA